MPHRYWAYEPDPEDELSEGVLLGTGDDPDELLEIHGWDVYIWDDVERDWL